MFVHAITQPNAKQYNTKFKAKADLSNFLKSEKIEKKIQQINKNSEAKELFGAMTALAGAAIAEFTIWVQQDNELKNIVNNIMTDLGLSVNGISSQNDQCVTTDIKQNKPFDLELCTKDVPERNLYLKITSYFPALDSKYKQLLETQQKEPDNKKNEFTLNIIESSFKYLSDDQRLMNMKPYFHALDEHADCIENIATNISSTIKNNQSLMYYLILLKNGKLSKEDIIKWSELDNLSCDDFMLAKNILDDTQINNLNNLRKQNSNFRLTELKKSEYQNYEKEVYMFKLDFLGNLSTKDKLKTISQIYETLNGEISLKDSKNFSDEYILKDLTSEMMESIIKDHRLDATYNFIKYIKPEALKDFNFSVEEIKFLDRNSSTFKNLKSVCIQEIISLDENNPKVQNIIEVLNDKEIFRDIITSRHAKIRFISRFVLKNNPNSDLKKDTKEKIEILEDILSQDLEKCNYMCYLKSKRNAPQFYIKGNKLGDYVKITLNHDGSIHTIFEDITREQKSKEQQEQAKNNKA